MNDRTEYRGLEDDGPPAYSTWDDDVVKDTKTKRWRTPTWALARETTKQHIIPAIKNTPSFVRTKAWPTLKKSRPTKKQVYAFLILLVFGIGPFVVAGTFTYHFDTAFVSKEISCGSSFGTPQNSTVSGVEGLFVLDIVSGAFTFSQVKVIDVAWDLIIGRGGQLLAWWASYVVFSNALLRVIERHPASFRTFAHISLQGASLGSMRALIGDLFKGRSKRTWLLFFYMLVSISWILALPTVLSAMTGYVNTSIAWVSTDDNQQIMPASDFKRGYFVVSAKNVTFNNTCEISDELSNIPSQMYSRDYHCLCSLSNGTLMNYWDYQAALREGLYSHNHPYSAVNLTNCTYDYPNNNQTFWAYTGKVEDGSYHQEQLQCNMKWNVTLDGQIYDYKDLNVSDGFCNNGKGYDEYVLLSTARCLPDTANPSYQWGFSTMLSSLFAIFHFVWAVTMYIIWQDAQFNSELVRSGYALTQLRAAFALATAASNQTGMKNKELLRAESKSLEIQLYGTRKKKEAEVDHSIFEHDMKVELSGEGLSRRRGWPRAGSSAA